MRRSTKKKILSTLGLLGTAFGTAAACNELRKGDYSTGTKLLGAVATATAASMALDSVFDTYDEAMLYEEKEKEIEDLIKVKVEDI